MTINWKIKLLNKSTSYYGNTAGTAIDDLDKIASSLGVKKDECFNVIQNCRPIKVSIRGGDVVDGVKFWYQVETKDKNIEVEGYQHGNASGGSEATWEFRGDWWLLKVMGSSGYIWGQTLIRRMDFWSYHINEYKTWTDGKGAKGDSDYNIVAPACFFSRTFNGMLGAFGAYQGELYDGKWDGIFWTNKPDIVKTWYDKLLNEWKVDFSTQFPGGLGYDTLALVKKELDNSLPFAKHYEELYTYYKDNLRKDYLNNVAFHPDGLKEAKKVLDQLRADKTQLETDKKTAEGERDAVKVELNKRPNTTLEEHQNLLNNQEKHTAEDLEKHKPEDLKPIDYDLIKSNLNKWTSAFPSDKYKNGVDDVSATIINLEGSKTNLDALTAYWNENISKDFELPKFSMEALTSLDNHLTLLLRTEQENKEAWKQNGLLKFGEKIDKNSLKYIKDEIFKLENNQEIHKAEDLEQHTSDQLEKHKPEDLEKHTEKDLKPKDYEEVKAKLTEWQTNFPNQEPGQIKNQITQQENQQTSQPNQYLSKLLSIYKEQIKNETEAFYLNDLKLDGSDDINPKYNGVEYLTLLDNLNGESEPRQVINAFKIVALIAATDKARGVSDKWINNPIAKKPAFKKTKLDYFNSLKNQWDINGELKTITENNPLYLTIISEKSTYKSKLENIITLWQTL